MPSGQSFEVERETTVLVAAVRNGLPLPHDCTEATCGTDRITVLSGQSHLSTKTEDEDLTLSMLNAGPDDRLGCVARILGDVVVEIPS